MILKIKHRASYYRRFQLDIWGLLRTTVFYKSSPVGPSEEAWTKFYARQPSFKLDQFLEVKDHWWDDIKPSSIQPIIVPWFYPSRKLSRLIDFFYVAYERRRNQKRERGRRYIYRLDLMERFTQKKPLKERFVSLRLVKLYYISYSYRQFRALARRMRSKYGVFEENFLLALEGRIVSMLYRMTFFGNPFLCLDFVRCGHVYIEGFCQPRPNAFVGLNRLVTFDDLGRRWIYHELSYRLGKRRVLFNAPRYIIVSYLFLYGYQRRPPLRRDLVFPIAVDFYRATGYAF